MSTELINDERVCEIAEDYKKRGYNVTIAPHSKSLPAFLNKFSPDIVAVSPNESVVIEIKSFRKSRSTDYWRELASAIQKHPGWRFELVIDNTTRREPPENIAPEKIRELLEEGQRLAKENILNAALLVTWSAIEAAMRLASKAHDVELPDFRPSTIISRLYTDGVLERDEYDFLMDCMKIRNFVAHGFQGEAIHPDFIDKLNEIALNLLVSTSQP
jgi:hypothetical protein